MTTLPAKILAIHVSDETGREMPRLKSWCVEIQSKYDSDEYLTWSNGLCETPAFDMDGVRFALYGVAVSGPFPFAVMTITIYTKGEEQSGDWARLALKWSERYGELYHGWIPNKRTANEVTVREMV